MLIRGDHLGTKLRSEVLAAYIYRWTSDNPHRGTAYGRCPPLVTDAEWLRGHYFAVTARGELSKRQRYAQPAVMVEA